MTSDLRERDDGQLLAAGSAGLGVLYDRYARAVLRLAIRILGDPDDADEVVQETFLLAWRKRRQVSIVGDSALPWLLTTARFEALSARRRAVRRAARQVPFVPELHDRPAAVETEESLAPVLAELSDRDRAVVQAVLIDELSYAEAAATLGVPVSTVGKRLQRARERLRRRLRDAGRVPGEGMC